MQQQCVCVLQSKVTLKGHDTKVLGEEKEQKACLAYNHRHTHIENPECVCECKREIERENTLTLSFQTHLYCYNHLKLQ